MAHRPHFGHSCPNMTNLYKLVSDPRNRSVWTPSTAATLCFGVNTMKDTEEREDPREAHDDKQSLMKLTKQLFEASAMKQEYNFLLLKQIKKVTFSLKLQPHMSTQLSVPEEERKLCPQPPNSIAVSGRHRSITESLEKGVITLSITALWHRQTLWAKTRWEGAEQWRKLLKSLAVQGYWHNSESTASYRNIHGAKGTNKMTAHSLLRLAFSFKPHMSSVRRLRGPLHWRMGHYCF